jgi:hypothetical protein
VPFLRGWSVLTVSGMSPNSHVCALSCVSTSAAHLVNVALLARNQDVYYVYIFTVHVQVLGGWRVLLKKFGCDGVVTVGCMLSVCVCVCVCVCVYVCVCVCLWRITPSRVRSMGQPSFAHVAVFWQPLFLTLSLGLFSPLRGGGQALMASQSTVVTLPLSAPFDESRPLLLRYVRRNLISVRVHGVPFLCVQSEGSYYTAPVTDRLTVACASQVATPLPPVSLSLFGCVCSLCLVLKFEIARVEVFALTPLCSRC